MEFGETFFWFVLIGLAAQLVDGALGMAYGLVSSSVLLGMGLPPAQVSASIHAAEVFTTGASGASHIALGNVDRRLFLRLAIPGVVGGVIGAYVLTQLPGDLIRPFVYLYLLVLAVLILVRASGRMVPRREVRRVPVLGFFAGLLDASGGGGWGPVVASTLIGSGHAPRHAVGSVNTTEFFVTVAAATTFFVELGMAPWQDLIALVIGGILAAPLGGWAVKRLPPRVLMTMVGILVVSLSAWQLGRALKFF